MQEVKILRWCDNHLLKEGVKSPSGPKPFTVTIDGVEAELDLCEACEVLLEPLRDLLRNVGSRAGARTEPAKRPVRAPAREISPPPPSSGGELGDKVRCSLCAASMELRSRGQHARTSHSVKGAADIDWIFGEGIAEVWACGCGLKFPDRASRDRHERHRTRGSCSVPPDDRPLPPKRSA